ncbi:hypothetical protein [Amycolatopsis thermophila]|uniref:hypothetical protein n=1 Tax=Amycolatopsis thermophila TaxID=206084 RepID=UPI003520A7FC
MREAPGAGIGKVNVNTELRTAMLVTIEREITGCRGAGEDMLTLAGAVAGAAATSPTTCCPCSQRGRGRTENPGRERPARFSHTGRPKAEFVPTDRALTPPANTSTTANNRSRPALVGCWASAEYAGSGWLPTAARQFVLRTATARSQSGGCPVRAGNRVVLSLQRHLGAPGARTPASSLDREPGRATSRMFGYSHSHLPRRATGSSRGSDARRDPWPAGFPGLRLAPVGCARAMVRRTSFFSSPSRLARGARRAASGTPNGPP